MAEPSVVEAAARLQALRRRRSGVRRRAPCPARRRGRRPQGRAQGRPLHHGRRAGAEKRASEPRLESGERGSGEKEEALEERRQGEWRRGDGCDAASRE